jgi:hypothetical protein
MTTQTKHKIAVLIEKHVITTKIGYLLRALDNCAKITKTDEIDKSKIYVTQTQITNRTNTDTKYYQIDENGKTELQRT